MSGWSGHWRHWYARTVNEIINHPINQGRLVNNFKVLVDGDRVKIPAQTSPESAGVLSDGTILAMFVAPSTPDAEGEAAQSGYYAWAPGAHSWQRVTPASPSYLPYASWLTMRPDGGYTIWVLGPAKGGGLLVASADLG
jgi:hypothetical protein